MECQICLDTFLEVYVVGCDSKVAHTICFVCEMNWRAKMPVSVAPQHHDQVMTCPSCRQPEKEPSMRWEERLNKRRFQEWLMWRQKEGLDLKKTTPKVLRRLHKLWTTIAR